MNGKFTLYLAPISGAIFALFLYFAFLGELLAGGVFPKIFVRPSRGRKDVMSVPTSGALLWDKELAKLLIWSFIAGFAERFVPDTIGRLVDRGREAAAPTATATQPAPPYGAQSSPPAAGSVQKPRSPGEARRPRG